MHGPTAWSWWWIFNPGVRTVSIGVKIELGGSSESGGRGSAVGPTKFEILDVCVF